MCCLFLRSCAQFHCLVYLMKSYYDLARTVLGWVSPTHDEAVTESFQYKPLQHLSGQRFQDTAPLEALVICNKKVEISSCTDCISPTKPNWCGAPKTLVFPIFYLKPQSLTAIVFRTRNLLMEKLLLFKSFQ